MSIPIKQFGKDISLTARTSGLFLSSSIPIDWVRPETWPAEARKQGSGRRTAFEVASVLEMGLGHVLDGGVEFPYDNFAEIESEDFRLTNSFTQPSPFLLKIDRSSDIGRPDFLYRYQYLLGSVPVPLQRFGFYVRRAATGEVFRLDERMYSLLEAMDSFNSLAPEEKGSQRSWLDFANIKQWSREANAVLDATLLKNDVVIPSAIGLDLFEDSDGALSFIPTCPELENESFRAVFERNREAVGLYTLDKPGLGKLRVVLNDRQLHVLERMKRVRGVTGEQKESLKRDPRPVFDGVTGDVELPYGDRVIGIGTYEFVPIPKAGLDEGSMADLFGDQASGTRSKSESDKSHEDKPEKRHS